MSGFLRQAGGGFLDQLVVSTAAPGTIEPDDAAAEGVATSLARSDHKHAIAAAAPGTISPDDTADEGVATSFARSDHRHAIAAATAGDIADWANAEGTSTSFARADHLHGHGNRGGGGLHSVAAAGGAAGFMTGTDKLKLDNLASDSKAGEVTTADATTTTVVAWTPPASSVVNIDVTVVGLKDDLSQAAGYRFVGTARVDGAGTVTMIGALVLLATMEDDAAWDATADTSGGQLRVRVTGVAATTIKWRAEVKITQRLNT